MVAEISNLIEAGDGYQTTVLEIEKLKARPISVPILSRLLGVKPTTINARFRREGFHAQTVGRTNYIPLDMALSLADMHRYALKGWPTLREVSRVTGLKTGTLKARCEKGKLEGYVDLTKRLRVNPAEVPHLSLDTRFQSAASPFSPACSAAKPASPGKPARPLRAIKPLSDFTAVGPRNHFALPPAPEPRVQVITAQEYGFSAAMPAANPSVKPSPPLKLKRSGALDYNPERPFSISQCSVGKTIRYEQYEGTILKLFADPFNPTVKVAIPNHVEPLMREIMLRVGR